MEDEGILIEGEQADSNAVTIMSIHSSKGLEFPVVFLCGQSRTFNREAVTQPVLCHKKLGLGMNYIDSVRELPPVLIFHGTNDELVPFGQSCMLYDKLVQCNKKAEFYAIENAHHGGREFWSNQVFDIIEDFIKS